MAILEGGHIVPPLYSSYIQKPRAIRVKHIRQGAMIAPILLNVKFRPPRRIGLIYFKNIVFTKLTTPSLIFSFVMPDMHCTNL